MGDLGYGMWDCGLRIVWDMRCGIRDCGLRIADLGFGILDMGWEMLGTDILLNLEKWM